MKDKEFNSKVWNQTVEANNKNHHHFMRGWSAVGYCKSKQTLDHLYHIPFNPKSTLPGTLGHKHYQENVFPAGAFVFERYYIVAHEVPVFLKINGHMRWSYIDTLVYDSIDKVFEVWDYKFAQYATYKQEEASKANIMQINLYGYLYGAVRLRIIYTDMKDYSMVYTHVLDVDKELALETIQRMQEVNSLKTGAFATTSYHKITDHLYLDPKKSNCKWCPHKTNHQDLNNQLHPPYCLLHLRKEFGIEFKTFNEARKHVLALKE